MVSPVPPEYWQKKSGNSIHCREFTVRSVMGLHAQCIEKRRKSSWLLPPTRTIEKEVWKWLTPAL
jgi:hypothetical protein